MGVEVRFLSPTVWKREKVVKGESDGTAFTALAPFSAGGAGKWWPLLIAVRPARQWAYCNVLMLPGCIVNAHTAKSCFLLGALLPTYLHVWFDRQIDISCDQR